MDDKKSELRALLGKVYPDPDLFREWVFSDSSDGRLASLASPKLTANFL